MENQILDLLIEMKTDMTEFKKEMKTDMAVLKKEIIDVKKDMSDRFDVFDIKLNAVENKVIQIGRKLDTTTDQVTRNIETI
ncbi:hypothetical protein LZ906_014710 [Paraclostridium ghonii]|uniref:hypothetical protein n=1 Tax=Paraclostridium ghonii TaxID=29358 RepID=UPI00202CBD7E|nr:hypothetical protein [Paeniclostridium ghonii]MCM0167440.1 hypothetical protein [Paeniclostridium ghonii]